MFNSSQYKSVAHIKLPLLNIQLHYSTTRNHKPNPNSITLTHTLGINHVIATTIVALLPYRAARSDWSMSSSASTSCIRDDTSADTILRFSSAA